MGRSGDGFWCQILNCPWRRNTDSALPHDTPSNLSFSITIRAPTPCLTHCQTALVPVIVSRQKKRVRSCLPTLFRAGAISAEAMTRLC